MGNLLTSCQNCQIREVCSAARLGIDQCEIRTDALFGNNSSRQGGTGGASRHAAGGGAQEGWRDRRGQRDYSPANMSEADQIQQAIWRSQLDAARARRAAMPNAGHPDPLLDEEESSLMAALAASYNNRAGLTSEEELAAAAAHRAEIEEESRQRAQLLGEQAQEYEESLRIDRQREADKALQLKEEEERRQCELAEAEAQRREAERIQAEAEEAERVRKEKADRVMEDAKKLLVPEPGPSEPNRVQVLIRTPSGVRLKRAFQPSDPIAQLYHYVNAEGIETLTGTEYRLVSSMPRAVYDDREMSIEAAGLRGQCTLLVEVMDD